MGETGRECGIVDRRVLRGLIRRMESAGQSIIIVAIGVGQSIIGGGTRKAYHLRPPPNESITESVLIVRYR